MSLIQRFVTKGVQQWAYNLSGFNQYGLHRDDLCHETPEVLEALKRVPAHLIEERNYRLIRAAMLDMQKRILPKEQWTKLEEDKLYLQPHLEEVLKEKHERETWEAEH